LLSWLFAYNETPTIAVAIDCWLWARQQLTRPFLWLSALRRSAIFYVSELIF
jgi:hypothetical protein